MNDRELLRAFVTNGSQDAFAQIVERHLGLVFSAALRQVGDRSPAEELTQTVFLVLARKASEIAPEVVLPAWLVVTTRFAAANARRREQRRRQAEHEIMKEFNPQAGADRPWTEIAPQLDEALTKLRPVYRNALVLRFFEHCSLEEVALGLGVSPGTAQKRVARGLEKLRIILQRRGAAVSVAALGGWLGTQCVHAAPHALGGLVLKASFASAAGSVGGAGVAAVTIMPGVVDTLRSLAWHRCLALVRRGLGLAGVAGLVALIGMGISGIGSNSGAPGGPSAETTSAAGTVAGRARSAAPGGAIGAAVVAAANAEPAAEPFSFRVIDAATDAPLTNARLTLIQYVDAIRVSNVVYTGDRGMGLLPSPMVASNWTYRIEVFRDGYVPKYVSWGASQADSIDQFPAAYSTRLDRGTAIGGRVVNEQGEPIGSVRLSFSVSGSTPGTTRERERLTMAGSYHSEVTDAAGRWICDHVPADFGSIEWRLLHPEYQDATYGSARVGQPTSNTRFPQADFIRKTVVMTMKRGWQISGRVQDEEGKPIVGASVKQARSYGRETTTDVDGVFVFSNARPTNMTVVIQAEGYAPIAPKVIPRPPAAAEVELRPQQFVLSRGVVVRGRVLDETGASVSNAVVAVPDPAKWQAFLFDWRGRTDADGHFEWPHAPTGQVFQATANGFETSEEFSLPADGSEMLVVLKASKVRRRLIVRVKALDAESGEPLREFQVETAQEQDSPTTRVLPPFAFGLGGLERTASGASGLASVPISSYTTDFCLQVSAKGYLPARFTNANRGQGEMQIEFQLTSAAPLSGQVIATSGEPISGVKLFLKAGTDSPTLTGPRHMESGRWGRCMQTESDAMGHFSFEPTIDMKLIVATHESGFATMPVADLLSGLGRKLVLQPWARLEGVFRIRDLPPSGQRILVTGFSFVLETAPFMTEVVDIRTGHEGEFVLDGLPPGQYWVRHSPSFRDGRPGTVPTGHDALITTQAGRTTRVEIGGTGTCVTGRITTQGFGGAIDWLNDVHLLVLQVPAYPPFVPPQRSQFESQAAFREAYGRFLAESRAFAETEAGLANQRAHRQYVLLFEPDGRFHVNDVPPGRYTLKIAPTTPHKKNSSTGFVAGTSIGTVERIVDIPEDPADQTEPILDLGDLALQR